VTTIYRFLVPATAALFLAASCVDVTPGRTNWERSYMLRGYNYGEAVSVAVGPNGDGYVLGQARNSTDDECFILGYSASGALKWQATLNGPHYWDEPVCVRCASDGKVWVAGRASPCSSFVAVYSSAGKLQSIALDSAGYDIIDLAPGPDGTVYAVTRGDGFAVTKFATDGSRMWTRNWPGQSWSGAEAVAAATDAGGVFVTGTIPDSTIDEYDEVATIKLDLSGNLLWSARYNRWANGADRPTAISVRPDGSVCVAGYSQGIALNASTAILLDYDAAGQLAWTATYAGDSTGAYMATSVGAASDGTVYLTACRALLGVDDSLPVQWEVMRYSAAGEQLWHTTYHGEGDNQAWATCQVVLGSGGTIVSGGSGEEKWVIGKFNQDGTLRWVEHASGAGCYAVAGGSGGVYAVGDRDDRPLVRLYDVTDEP
jgi:hypothetical protein